MWGSVRVQRRINLRSKHVGKGVPGRTYLSGVTAVNPCPYLYPPEIIRVHHMSRSVGRLSISLVLQYSREPHLLTVYNICCRICPSVEISVLIFYDY